MPDIITRSEARALGLKRYFNGIPCPKGHISERFVCSCSCAECLKLNPDAHRTAAKKYYESNRAKVNAATLGTYHRDKAKTKPRRDAYRASHKAEATAARKIRQAAKKSQRALLFAANAERVAAERARRKKEWEAAYRAKHREKLRAHKSKYRDGNREAVNAGIRKYVEENKETVRATKRVARAKRLGAEGTHNAKEVAALRVAQNDQCIYCRTSLNGSGHLDHIVSLKRGGTDYASNLQWLCKPCNLRKSAKDPVEFARAFACRPEAIPP